MAISSKEFVAEIQRMVRAKHSKNHPIIGMIEEGDARPRATYGLRRPILSVFPETFSEADRGDVEPLPG